MQSVHFLLSRTLTDIAGVHRQDTGSTISPPAPPSRAPRAPAKSYRPFRLARPSIPTELDKMKKAMSGRMMVKMIAKMIALIITILLLHKLGLRLLIRPWSYDVSEYMSIQLGNGLKNGSGLILGGWSCIPDSTVLSGLWMTCYP
jgi:hypothetical protein